MGQTLSEQIEEMEKEKKTHSQALKLRKIERDMRQKFEEKKATLYIGALNDECLPIICAVDTFYDFLYVDKKKDLSGIDIILDKHLSGKYKAKFVDLIKRVVENVLKKRSAESYMHVVYANMSFLRIDYYIYFIDGTLFYFVQVGVLDMERVRLPVLIYELTRATQPTHLEELVVKAKRRAKSSRILHQTLKHLVDAAKQTAVQDNEEKKATESDDDDDDEEEEEEGEETKKSEDEEEEEEEEEAKSEEEEEGEETKKSEEEEEEEEAKSEEEEEEGTKESKDEEEGEKKTEPKGKGKKKDKGGKSTA